MKNDWSIQFNREYFQVRKVEGSKLQPGEFITLRKYLDGSMRFWYGEKKVDYYPLSRKPEAPSKNAAAAPVIVAGIVMPMLYFGRQHIIDPWRRVADRDKPIHPETRGYIEKFNTHLQKVKVELGAEEVKKLEIILAAGKVTIGEAKDLINKQLKGIQNLFTETKDKDKANFLETNVDRFYDNLAKIPDTINILLSFQRR